jgi:predicted PurR-regulated permease PerM
LRHDLLSARKLWELNSWRFPTNIPSQPDQELEQRLASPWLDVLIRGGLILAMAMLCYRVFSPFLHLMVWALILAVTLYPLHQFLASKMGGKQGLAATLLVITGIVLIVAPTAILMSSLADSVRQLVSDVQNNTLKIPAPRPGVEQWPVVGKQIHDVWSKLHADLPSMVQSMQPKIGELAKTALGFVASVGGGLLQFLASFIIAGIIMAFGQSGSRASQAIFERIIGPDRGSEFARLSTATIRAVAQGVIGVAFIQAILCGLALLVAGVPWAGVLALIVLVLSLAQVPALIVTLPAIVYIWSSGNYSNVAAIAYTVVLFVSGLADNVLKPLMLGKGVDAPMPVILLGALGGMATAGILGMFVGATLLALGYQLFMGWVTANQNVGQAQAESNAQSAR